MTSATSKARKPGNPSAHLPRSIWMLGFVSLFMDISSELVHSLLPVFMATVLGASFVTIGIIEGIAEGVAAIMKVFSGTLSDYFGKRKPLAVLGYALGAISKTMFPFATTIGLVVTARFIDRLGKGIRGAPRDALVADIVTPQLRGAAYGLRQALDSAGAFVGPLLAMLFMILLASDIKTVLWIAVLPALLSVIILMLGVSEPANKTGNIQYTSLSLTDTRQLPLRYWLVVGLGAVFTLARFSEAFLILRAQDLGLAIAYVPAIMIVMNLVYALFAYPAGAAADRLSSSSLLIFGLLLLFIADLILAMTSAIWFAFIGAAFWGLHMAFTQGLLAKLVADTSPQQLRGTAFGIFNLISGVALFLASVIAGLLWHHYGATGTFLAGACFAITAATGLLIYRLKK